MSINEMNQSAFNFQSLTPDLLLDSLESIGIRAESGLTPLNSYENRVYQFIDEDRQRYVVKFYRPERWNKEQIIEEHQFTFELAEAEIPVVTPKIIDRATLHHYSGFYFALFPSIGGRSYEVDNEYQLECVARFLGRIHKKTEKKCFSMRPTIGLDEYVYQPRSTLIECPLIPKKLQNRFIATLDKLISVIEQYWQDVDCIHRLHGDCHPGNILWRDEPLFVDFDDARNGPAVQDLWMLLHGDRREQLIQLDILLEAYSEFADFDPKQLLLIEPLRAMRMIHYLAWVAKRWSDPAFPANFPWMKDETFWFNQLSLFNEQIKLLHTPSLKLMSMI